MTFKYQHVVKQVTKLSKAFTDLVKYDMELASYIETKGSDSPRDLPSLVSLNEILTNIASSLDRNMKRLRRPKLPLD
jgi:hypothetical protein